jgi:hypothetical protein
MEGVLARLNIIDISNTIPRSINNKGHRAAKLTPNVIENIIRKMSMLKTILDRPREINTASTSINLNAKRDRLATYGVILLDINEFKNQVIRMSLGVKSKVVKLIPDYMKRIRDSWNSLFQSINENETKPLTINNNTQPITNAVSEDHNAPLVRVNPDGSRVVDYGDGKVELYSKEGNRIEDNEYARYNIAPQNITPIFNGGNGNNDRVNELLERNARLETDISAEKIRSNQLQEALDDEKNRPSTQLDHIERIVLDIRDNMEKLIIPALNPILKQDTGNKKGNDTVNDPSILNNDHYLIK